MTKALTSHSFLAIVIAIVPTAQIAQINAHIPRSNALAFGTYVNFETSMGRGHSILGKGYEMCAASPADSKILTKFKKLYNTNNFARVIPQSTPKIPKIIHQIWLGSPVPEKFDNYRKSWKTMHPDWEYKLWTDADIEALHLENKACYNAAINYAERSDIARYEIIYRFGGVYADIDMECVKPIDILHHTYDFYVGFEPLAEAPFLKRLVIIPNGFFGARPGHPTLRKCIDSIEAHRKKNDIVLRTGPIFFSDIIIETIDKGNDINIVLPASFFFPFGKQVKTPEDRARCVKPETFTKHYWAGSWIFNPKAFIPGVTFKIRVTRV